MFSNYPGPEKGKKETERGNPAHCPLPATALRRPRLAVSVSGSQGAAAEPRSHSSLSFGFHSLYDVIFPDDKKAEALRTSAPRPRAYWRAHDQDRGGTESPQVSRSARG